MGFSVKGSKRRAAIDKRAPLRKNVWPRMKTPRDQHTGGLGQGEGGVLGGLGLTAGDFDAYLAERSGSARARLDLKERMLAWSDSVVARLKELGIAVTTTGSDVRKVECQRVFFWQDDEGTHAFLALTIDAKHVEVSLELPLEAHKAMKSFRARLDDPERSLEVGSALERLPEQFLCGLLANESPRRGPTECLPAHETQTEAVRTLIDRRQAGLWIGWSIPRDLALEHADLLNAQLGDALVALCPLFKLMAYEPKPKRAQLNEGRTTKLKERRARTRALAMGTPEPVPSEREIASPPIVKEPTFPSRRLPLRKPMVHGVDAKLPVEKGTHVKVLAGPFMGKEGVVQELDGKGGARVMLGLLAARLEVTNLIASAEDRKQPSLSSSHRKPLPAR